jgi:hypothetical protein
LAGLYPFFDIFASDISGFKKELLGRTKKPKEKAQVPERNTLNNDVKDIKQLSSHCFLDNLQKV